MYHDSPVATPPMPLLRTRFAPSPTGYLHLGHIVSALYVWAVARKHRAEVLLRIEDHDQQRSKPAFSEAIRADLTWLGLITPHTKISHQGNHRQRYLDALAHLAAQGLVYACSCSRADVLAMNVGKPGEDLFYSGKCRPEQALPVSLEALQGAHVIRFRLESESLLFNDGLCGQQVQTPAKQCGDFILVDGKKNFSYHLANVVDDLHEGISLIVRGEDILNSTGRQLLLRRSLDPCKGEPSYYHHPLLYEESGKGKLSKRHQSVAIGLRREQGVEAQTIFAEALWRLGLRPEVEALDLEDALAIIAEHC